MSRDRYIPEDCEFFRVSNCSWLALVPVFTYLDVVILQNLVMYVHRYFIMSLDVFFHCKDRAASCYMLNGFFEFVTKETHWIGSILADPMHIIGPRKHALFLCCCDHTFSFKLQPRAHEPGVCVISVSIRFF